MFTKILNRLDILIIWPNIYKYRNGVIFGYKNLLLWLKDAWYVYAFVAWYNRTIFNIFYIFFTKHIYLISFPQRIAYILAKIFPKKLFFIATDSVDSDYNTNIKLLSLHNVYKIQPTNWFKKHYIKKFPELNPSKIILWYYGVDTDIENDETKKEYNFFVYVKYFNNLETEKEKNDRRFMLQQIISYLNKKNYTYKIIEYGDYQLDDWFDTLQKSQYWIFLTGVESQWLAKIESIIHRVPFLNFEYEHDYLSTFSFMTSDIGHNFFSFDDFTEKIDLIDDVSLTEEVVNQFSRKTQAQKMIQLFISLQK